jgi:hypothetical protein
VALGMIDRVPKEHKFHFQETPQGWWKVDMCEVLLEGVALMFPNKVGDQHKSKDAKGSATMWVDRYMKSST